MADNLNINITVDAWAKITVERWKAELNRLNVFSTGALYESFSHEITGGESPEVVRFRFNDYGIYVNFGVGKEFKVGNKGDLGMTPGRQEKRWYSPVIYREVNILSRILAEKYGMKAANSIVSAIRSQIKEE